MGVDGLATFIGKIDTPLWTNIELKNTRLVIDGSALYHYLYKNEKFDCRYGGQYDEFYNVVFSFFSALNSKGIKSFVVLDGPRNITLDENKERAEKMIETSNEIATNLESTEFLLPLLSKLVFIEALRDLTDRGNNSIKFAVFDREADAEIASLAKEWNCPVLSNDSDFFIFDIKGGYIPLEFFKWKSGSLKATIFHRRKLASHLGIRPKLFPLLASLAGNDYVSRDMLTGFRLAMNSKEEKFLGIANFISELPNSSTVEERVEFAVKLVSSKQSRDQLRKAVNLSLQEYTITKSNLLPYFESNEIDSSLRTQNDYEIEEWILCRFRAGRFPVKCMSVLTTGMNFLKPQIENCHAVEVSANRCSQSLRRLVYGILYDAAALDEGGNIGEVEEWYDINIRLDSQIFTFQDVSPHQEGVVLGTSLIPSLHKEETTQILLDALDSNTAYITSLPEKFKLIAASLRYLINNAQPMLETNHLVALLCCCVDLQEKLITKTIVDRRVSSHTFDLKAVQSFAQWQCVLRDAINLNNILQEPVATPCIHKTFNGRFVHYLRDKLDKGRGEKLMEELIYKKLYTAVTDGLEAKLIKKRTFKDVKEEDIAYSGIPTRVHHRCHRENIFVKQPTEKVLKGGGYT